MLLSCVDFLQGAAVIFANQKKENYKVPCGPGVVRGEVYMGEDKVAWSPPIRMRWLRPNPGQGAALLLRRVLDLSRTEDTSGPWGDVPGQRKWNFSTNGTVHLRPARPHRAHRDLWKRREALGLHSLWKCRPGIGNLLVSSQ